MLLRRLVGPLSSENGELWDCVTALFLSRDWDVGRARIFICWVAGGNGNDVNEEGWRICLSLYCRVVSKAFG